MAFPQRGGGSQKLICSSTSRGSAAKTTTIIQDTIVFEPGQQQPPVANSTMLYFRVVSGRRNNSTPLNSALYAIVSRGLFCLWPSGSRLIYAPRKTTGNRANLNGEVGGEQTAALLRWRLMISFQQRGREPELGTRMIAKFRTMEMLQWLMMS